MFRNVYLAVAILMACPAFVSAQDLILSFSPTELVTTASGEVGETGSVYILSDALFSFNAFDLDFSASSSCLNFTGGEVFDVEELDILPRRFDVLALTFDEEGSSGNLFAVASTQLPFGGPFPGVCPPNIICPNTPDAPNIGPNGAYLLARADYEIVEGGKNIDLEFALGDQGALLLPATVLNPSLGSATIELQPPAPILLGDINLDGIVDFFDIFAFIAVLFSREYQLEADLNEDGAVNFLDIPYFITYLNG